MSSLAAIEDVTVVLPAVVGRGASAGDKLDLFYHGAFETSASGVIIVGCNGEIFLINPAARHLLHRPDAKAGQLFYSLFVHNPSFDCIVDIVFQGLSSPSRIHSGQVAFWRGHDLVHLDIKVSKFRDQNGALVGAVVTLNDVTHQQLRTAFASVFASAVAVVFFYVSLLGFFSELLRTTETGTLMNSLLMLLPAAGSLYIATQTALPIELLGLSWKNGWHNAREAVLLSIVACGVLAGALYLLHEFVPAVSEIPVVKFSWEKTIALPTLLGLALYVALTPLQEFLARGTLQAPLEQVLTGKYRHWAANILANLMFSVFHEHLGLSFAILVLLPGLFWGWMFSRQKTLIGVSISHAIIGVFALNVVSVREYFAAMF